MGKIVVYFGPSSAGKSNLQKSLTSPQFPRIVTATTRAQREGEANGVDYMFMKRDAFQQQLEHGDFVESTIYNGEYYGTLKSSIEEVLAGHLDAHIIMDLAGVLALKRLTADIIAVYIGANLSSIKRRLLERGSSVDEVTWRLNKAIEVELTDAYLEHADVVIWNHDGTDFNETVKRVKEAIQ